MAGQFKPKAIGKKMKVKKPKKDSLTGKPVNQANAPDNRERQERILSSLKKG